MAKSRYSAASVRRAQARAERAELADKISNLKLREMKAKTEAARLKLMAERKNLEYLHYKLRQRRGKK